MSQDCIFCKIVAGDIPGDVVYSDDKVVAFRDINPQAPVHVLIIPRAHVGSIASVTADVPTGHMLTVAAQIARDEGIEESGYRLVFNVGPDGGESVPHLHLHLLGGRAMAWPPG